MAKLISYNCGSLCLLLLILRISVVFSTSERHIYVAEPNHRSEDTVSVTLIESSEDHILTKRAVQNGNVAYSTSSTAPPRVPMLKTTVPAIVTTVPSRTNEQIDTTTVNKTTPQTTTNGNSVKILSSAPTNTIPEAPALEHVPQNVGVNGSGILRNVTLPLSTESVPTLSTNMPPHINNLPPNVSVATSPESMDGDDIDRSILSSFGDVDNKTLQVHNITEAKNDTYGYYNSEFYNKPDVFRQTWVDLDSSSETRVHNVLSQSHRRAATVTLSFDFPFYGNLIRNVTIATGGFLYTGNYIHAWLAATQYIAPLMANFDLSLSNESFVKFLDNGTSFTVEWQKVALQERPGDGEFTFQATLHNNGDINFAYQHVPIKVENINQDYHPVKVGLSDAYIIDRKLYFIRRKTIYEYHRVNFYEEDIRDGTVIRLIALPTCLDFQDCASCLSSKLDNFTCTWCPGAQKCSSGGMDRNRHLWYQKGCNKTSITEEAMCSHISPSDIFDNSDPTYVHDSHMFEQAQEDYSKTSRVYQDPNILPRTPAGMGVTGIVAVLFLITSVIGMAMWILYAYRNPHTTSGQILIRYRPSQWRWRRGEARYTAATIHM